MFCLLCGLPKDYEMKKDILIQLWMANGFLQEEVTMDLVQKGEFIFRYLVWRSFLQDVKVNEFYHGDATVCKMHDLMHDLAKDVTDECATVEGLIQQKASLEDARHMQIGGYMQPMPRSELEQISGLLKGTTSLYTLLMTSTRNMDLKTMDLKKLKLKSLRAFCCDSFSITDSQVVNAKHLRYLDLSWSDIVRLPDSVSMLYNLQTLRLNYCRKLQRLPEGISAMRKLVHLYLLQCNSLEHMPLNISLLINLCTLTTFVVDTESGRGIEELEDLCHLGNRLELYNLRKTKSGQNAMKAGLHRKQNLKELWLYWGRWRGHMPEDEVCNSEQVLESLAPHSKLQILEVDGYDGLEVSQWMRDPRMFQCLRKLTISNCPRCKDLPIVWLSASLEYLCVIQMGSLTTLCKSIEVEAEGYNTCLQYFPKLKEMFLYELPSLERWTGNDAGDADSTVMFPMLEELIMYDCPKLASVPSSPIMKILTIRGCCGVPFSSLAHLTTLSELAYDGTGSVSTSLPLVCFPSLVKLEVWSVANMMMVPLEDQQGQSERRNVETLGNLSLIGSNCFGTPSSLSRSQLRLWECFAFVEELTIVQCNGIVCWPVEELQSLARLRSLVIWICKKLEGKGSSSEETLLLPLLERLCIRGCDSLLEIPKLPASLKELQIYECHSLVALPSNLGDLARLRVLVISGCGVLKVLSDGNEMHGLTSLEQFSLSGCTGIEEFPQGLLQWLPALKSLRIECCHAELERRCREGGEYFHLLSPIPGKYIGVPWGSQQEETGSSMKKLVRRLLPFCADS